MNNGDMLTDIDHIAHIRRGVDRVRYVMQEGGWWTYWDIQKRVWVLWGRHYSEACISARIRDLRKAEHGAHTVLRRKRPGTQATFEYQILDDQVEDLAA